MRGQSALALPLRSTDPGNSTLRTQLNDQMPRLRDKLCSTLTVWTCHDLQKATVIGGRGRDRPPESRTPAQILAAGTRDDHRLLLLPLIPRLLVTSWPSDYYCCCCCYYQESSRWPSDYLMTHSTSCLNHLPYYNWCYYFYQPENQWPPLLPMRLPEPQLYHHHVLLLPLQLPRDGPLYYCHVYSYTICCFLPYDTKHCKR